MSRAVVYHSLYGCETGCCGHTVELDDGRSRFEFGHPWGDDPLEYAKEAVRAAFGEEHVKDLDWESCLVVDGD